MSRTKYQFALHHWIYFHSNPLVLARAQDLRARIELDDFAQELHGLIYAFDVDVLLGNELDSDAGKTFGTWEEEGDRSRDHRVLRHVHM